ncbi:MAG: alpha/beta hydrolase [Acidimicrobiales bacterium]
MTPRTHVPITNGRLGYRCVGDGPDIVFVHGWPLHREIWAEVAAALPGHRCHLIDLPGAGDSVMDDAVELGFDSLLRGLGEAIDELSLERFAVVASDSGGMVARRLVADRGEQVTALVLTGTEIPNERPWLLRLFLAVSRLPFAASLLRLNLGTRLLLHSPLVLGGAFDDRSLIDGAFHRSFVEPLLTDRSLMKRQLEVLRSYRWSDVDALLDVHARISAPTLLLWGANDPVFPADTARGMLDQFAGPAAFESIERGKLFAFAEFPDHFAARAAAFLASSVRAV